MTSSFSFCNPRATGIRFAKKHIMLSSCLRPLAIVALCLLIIPSYAFPPAARFDAKGNPIFYKNFNKPNVSAITSPQRVAGKPFTSTFEPEWEVTCTIPSEVVSWRRIGDDCTAICARIESSEGANRPRIYSQADTPLVLVNGNCFVTMFALRLGATDVYKPNLIAQTIRYVVERCSGFGLGGSSNIGPRGKFELMVSNLGANDTDATS